MPRTSSSGPACEGLTDGWYLGEPQRAWQPSPVSPSRLRASRVQSREQVKPENGNSEKVHGFPDWPSTWCGPITDLRTIRTTERAMLTVLVITLRVLCRGLPRRARQGSLRTEGSCTAGMPPRPSLCSGTATTSYRIAGSTGALLLHTVGSLAFLQGGYPKSNAQHAKQRKAVLAKVPCWRELWVPPKAVLGKCTGWPSKQPKAGSFKHAPQNVHFVPPHARACLSQPDRRGSARLRHRVGPGGGGGYPRRPLTDPHLRLLPSFLARARSLRCK